ncbi:hypothetical protein B0H19DRAFT_1079888 [Mycena capillaripes]|nr:hypothetical protein B0H19DRAFT_1079888 [Mycena capillaripes]
MRVTVTIFFFPTTAPPPPHVDERVLASMSRYWAGDNAWTNPPSQDLLQRCEGSGGSSEYGSGAFDVMSHSWSYLSTSNSLGDGLSANPPASFFDPSPTQADVPTSVRTIPPTESHTLLHQTLNSVPVSMGDELQHILNWLGPYELTDTRTISVSPFPSHPPSSASDYSMFETHTGSWSNPDASLGHYYSGLPSSGGDFDWHDDSFEAFQESTSAFVPPLASDLEQHEQGLRFRREQYSYRRNDFETLPESTSNHSTVDWDSDASLQSDFDVKGLSSDDGDTPYELTPDEIDVVIGHTNASVTSSSARHCWPWRDSAIVWTDPGVSSKVVDFPDEFPITTKTKVFHIELVNGIPSQFPIPEEATAFIVCTDTLAVEDRRKTIDAILKDYDPHSYGGSTGSCREPDAFITGSLFGLDPSIRVACRRVEAKCTGVVACQSLDAAFLSAPRCFPDPVYRQALIEAEMRTRELQDTSAVGRSFSCKAMLADGGSCKGTALMTQPRLPSATCIYSTDVPDRPLSPTLSNAADGTTQRSVYTYIVYMGRQTSSSTHHLRGYTHPLSTRGRNAVILFKVLNRQPIVEEHDAGALCSRVMSGRQGFKGKAFCPYNHMKDGMSFKAKIIALGGKAIYHAYCPWEDRHFTHLPPPENKINQTVARLYMECARKLGSSATPARVDRAPTTIALLGTTPALFHPALANRDIRLRLVQRVKEELNGPKHTGNVRNRIGELHLHFTEVAVYLAQQQALPPAERYLQSSIIRDGRRVILGINPDLIKNIHLVQTLDCDTTFKPVVGSMQIFEVNAWLAAINVAVTLGRVWMEAHDRTIFKQVWEELRSLVSVLTGRPLLFKGLHVRGTILGLNADMEVVPLLGFADAFLPTIDRDELRGVVTDAGTLLLYVLRLCYTHIFRGIPEAPHLSKDDHNRIQNFVHLESSEAVEDFKVWIADIPDPNWAIARWWKQKLQQFWLLPAKIQCLSRIPLNDWHTMPAITNLGEAQHARNNAETGTQMGMIESFKNSNRRHAAATDKGMRARDADERVVALRHAKAQVEVELKQATAEAKSNAKQTLAPHRSSSRVASRSKELGREDIQEDEREVCGAEKRVRHCNWVKKQLDRAKSPSAALNTSAPLNAKHRNCTLEWSIPSEVNILTVFCLTAEQDSIQIAESQLKFCLLLKEVFEKPKKAYRTF